MPSCSPRGRLAPLDDDDLLHARRDASTAPPPSSARRGRSARAAARTRRSVRSIRSVHAGSSHRGARASADSSPTPSWRSARRRRSPLSSAAARSDRWPVVLNQPPPASSQNSSSCRCCSATAHSSHAGSRIGLKQLEQPEDQAGVVFGVARRSPRGRRDTAAAACRSSAFHIRSRMNDGRAAGRFQVRRGQRDAVLGRRPPARAPCGRTRRSSARSRR